MPHEAGNDFRFADWRMDLLEELFAESENALGLRCPAAVVIANLLEAAWRSFVSVPSLPAGGKTRGGFHKTAPYELHGSVSRLTLSDNAQHNSAAAML